LISLINLYILTFFYDYVQPTRANLDFIYLNLYSFLTKNYVSYKRFDSPNTRYSTIILTNLYISI